MRLAARAFEWDGGWVVCHVVYCPACKRGHSLTTGSENGERPAWTFDGNWKSPSFTPSWKGTTRYPNGDHICHWFLMDGVFNFCGDCTHEMAGHKVPMIDFPENYRV